MSDRWLILADDLTGAADCAIAFARRGVPAAVGWGDTDMASEARPSVFSYDADSRGLGLDESARRHAAALEALREPDRALFKKIDSTLRGQPAAETAAMIAHLRAATGGAFGVCAPAFPATGRTTVGGRIHVAGRPLEETEVWRREHSYESAELVAVFRSAGVAAALVPLGVVRASRERLRAALATNARTDVAVAVCDAETDGDLARIAEASLPAAPSTFFIGSAGLAHALAAASGAEPAPPPKVPATTQGSLLVVGSLAAASRAGARALAASGRVLHLPVAPEALLADACARAALGARVAAALDAGADVLVEIAMGADPDLGLGHRIADGLADALAPAAARMGAFAATGGETAAALLARFGVNGIRLVDELEPGVALGLTLGRLSVPVVTKAGAFGDDGSLVRIAERLAAVRLEGALA